VPLDSRPSHRVVDDQPDREHDGEQREQVDREPATSMRKTAPTREIGSVPGMMASVRLDRLHEHSIERVLRPSPNPVIVMW